eukprot:sb/3468833/
MSLSNGQVMLSLDIESQQFRLDTGSTIIPSPPDTSHLNLVRCLTDDSRLTIVAAFPSTPFEDSVATTAGGGGVQPIYEHLTSSDPPTTSLIPSESHSQNTLLCQEIAASAIAELALPAPDHHQPRIRPLAASRSFRRPVRRNVSKRRSLQESQYERYGTDLEDLRRVIPSTNTLAAPPKPARKNSCRDPRIPIIVAEPSGSTNAAPKSSPGLSYATKTLLRRAARWGSQKLKNRNSAFVPLNRANTL